MKWPLKIDNKGFETSSAKYDVGNQISMARIILYSFQERTNGPISIVLYTNFLETQSIDDD